MKHVQLPSVKFVHVREYDASGLEKPNGGMTVAFTRVSTVEDDHGGVFVYHAAKSACSRRDVFCKKIGRSIAHGRLTGGLFDVVKTTKTRIQEVADEMRTWAMTNGN